VVPRLESSAQKKSTGDIIFQDIAGKEARRATKALKHIAAFKKMQESVFEKNN